MTMGCMSCKGTGRVVLLFSVVDCLDCAVAEVSPGPRYGWSHLPTGYSVVRDGDRWCVEDDSGCRFAAVRVQSAVEATIELMAAAYAHFCVGEIRLGRVPSGFSYCIEEDGVGGSVVVVRHLESGDIWIPSPDEYVPKGGPSNSKRWLSMLWEAALWLMRAENLRPRLRAEGLE